MVKRNLIITIVIYLFIGSPNFSLAQPNVVLKTLQDKYQKCLDQGANMVSCSLKYYEQMDSLLNVQYKILRSKCDSIQKANLKDEQLSWLKNRDMAFKLNKKKSKEELNTNGISGGQDEQMLVHDKNAEYVKQRVIELSKASPKNYSPEIYTKKSTGNNELNSKTRK